MGSFVSNFLSSLLGVVIGFLIVMGIHAYLRRKMEREREQQIIHLIKEELKTNADVLKSLIEEQQRKQFTYIYLTLRDDLWIALSASGSLRGIKNTEMVGRFSNAYSLIRIVADLSDKYYRHTYLNSIGEDVRNVTRDSLCRMTLQASEMVEGALKATDLTYYG